MHVHSMSELQSYKVQAIIRGYHVYKEIWDRFWLDFHG